MPLVENNKNLTLAQVMDNSPVATFVLDEQHRVVNWNQACAVLTGVPADEMIGTCDQWRAFYPQQRPVMADLILNGSLNPEFEAFYQGKYKRSALIEGAYEAEDFFPNFGTHGRWLFFTAAPIRDGEGKIVGAIETLQDVTERHLAQLALEDNEAYLGHIVDGSSVATLVIDKTHHVTHWNHACEILTGTLAKDVIGTNEQWRAFYASERPIMADLVLEGAQIGAVDRLYHGRFKPSMLVQDGYEAEDFFPHFGADGRWLFFTAAPLRNAHGEIVGAIETLQDVTERRRAEEALRESEERYRMLSVTDPLTGLFNSRHMHECLQAEVERAERYGRPLSVMVLDADHFKRVNDTYGHLMGDQVLQGLAKVIKQALRKTDTAFRYGGEEFVVVMPEATETAALVLANRLRQHFADQVFSTERQETFSATISIGLAQFRHRESLRELLQRADGAVYEAKRAGRNRVVVAN